MPGCSVFVLAAIQPGIAVYHFASIGSSVRGKHLEHLVATTVRSFPCTVAVLQPCGWSVQMFT